MRRTLLAGSVFDQQSARWLRGVRQAIRLPVTQKVLHVHGVIGAEQRTVEHAVGLALVRAPGFRQAEAPGFDAFVPVGEGEAEVIAGTRADHQGAIPLRVSWIRQTLRDQGHALFVGAALGIQAALAVADRDLRAGHRGAQIQSRHPGQRGARAPFEMHAKIGDQRGGAHEHGHVLAEQ